MIAAALRGWYRRASQAREQGFTIVELIIALALIGLVMASLAPAFYGSLQGNSTTNQRTEANGLAIQATEELRAVPYSQLGYATSSSGPPACLVSPKQEVAGGTNGVTTSGINVPSSQSVGSMTFTVTPCVYWVTASNDTTGAYDYKQTIVTVTWTNAQGTQTVAETSDVYSSL